MATDSAIAAAVAAQDSAIAYSGSVVVEACPGAGKTRVVVERYLGHAEACRGRRGVAALSFTNRAVREIRDRSLMIGKPSLMTEPHYVGTLDSFMAQFVAVPFTRSTQPIRVVDSWDRLRIRVRASSRERSEGLPLDALVLPADGGWDIDDKQVPFTMRSQVNECRERYINAARRRREELNRAGMWSCADVRQRVLDILLHEADVAACMSRALRSRFEGIIVDEAQDCGEAEITLLRRLFADGIPLTIVCDKNQAIYEWRNARPELLAQLADDIFNRVILKGNWRSNQRIIDFSSTVQRNREPIVSVSQCDGEAGGVLLLPHRKSEVGTLLTRFRAWIAECNDEIARIVVLAHQLKHANDVAGLEPPSTIGRSGVERLARASACYWNADAEPQEIANSVDVASRFVLEMLGIDKQRTVEQMASEADIDMSWLRRVSVGMLRRLPVSDSQTVGDWVTTCRTVIDDVALPKGMTIVKNLIRSPSGKKNMSVATLVGSASDDSVVASTIHSAKGSEADAVLVSMPHDGARSSRTNDLIRAWTDVRDGEEKRVLYVGLTRARKFLGVGVPERHYQGLIDHLQFIGVEFSDDRMVAASA